MWIAKIIFPYDYRTLFGSLAKKHRVTLIGYPVYHEIKKHYVKVITSGMILGGSVAVKSFCDALRKDKRTLKLELKDNYAIIYIKQSLANKYLFQPGIFHTAPIIVNRKGEYFFELASWEKQKLIDVYKSYKKFGGKLRNIKERSITHVNIMTIFPALTYKQKRCFQLAVDNHYYSYPRKIHLKKLARLAGISYSTYQFHLRSAEKKIMPFLSKNI